MTLATKLWISPDVIATRNFNAEWNYPVVSDYESYFVCCIQHLPQNK